MIRNNDTLTSKLRSEDGFTLAELLVSVVFIGLLCIVISVGLGAALSAYGTVTQESNTHQLMARTTQEINDELAFSLSIDADNKTYESPSSRTLVTLVNSTDNNGIAIRGLGIGGVALDAEGEAVLVPGVDGLVPRFAEGKAPTYNKSNNTWSYTIEIVNTNADSDVVVETRVMTVARNMPASA